MSTREDSESLCESDCSDVPMVPGRGEEGIKTDASWALRHKMLKRHLGLAKAEGLAVLLRSGNWELGSLELGPKMELGSIKMGRSGTGSFERC